jgi:predicted transposase YdaD
MQTVAEQIHARGEAKGRKEGREEGRAEGRAEGEKQELVRAILLTLGRRFGPLPPEIAARVENTQPEFLDNLLDRAVTASTLDEAFAGTDRH